jgi:outer membrane protein OmpU
MIKKTLLASSALVVASLLAAPAMAGSVGSKDAMNVTVGGQLWFATTISDQDISAAKGRGYSFAVNESEVHVTASNTADNGIKYGVTIELNTGGADTTGADEAYAFIASDSWGRLELGDNDDVTNKMQIGSWNAHKGLGGPIGGLGMMGTGWEGGLPQQARSDWQPVTSGDATKASYMSPRFSGFQVGASLTPDSGQNSGATGESDSNGSFNNIVGFAANYKGKFDDVGVGMSIGYEKGDGEDTYGAGSDALEILGVGGNVSMAGFTVGASYRDYNDTRLTAAQVRAGASGGSHWSVGAGYQAGPWGVSVWYLDAEFNAATSAITTEVARLGFGTGYTVAPGWLLRADLEFLSHDNVTGTTDNDGTAFMLTNLFLF